MITSIEFVIAHVRFSLGVSEGLMGFLCFDDSLIGSLGTTCRKAAILDVFLRGKEIRLLSVATFTLNCSILTCLLICFRSSIFAVVIGRHIFRIVSRMHHSNAFFFGCHASKVLVIYIIEGKLFLLLILSRHRAKFCSNSRRRNHLLVDPNSHITGRIYGFIAHISTSLWPLIISSSILKWNSFGDVFPHRWVLIECWNRCLIKFDFKFWISFSGIRLWF